MLPSLGLRQLALPLALSQIFKKPIVSPLFHHTTLGKFPEFWKWSLRFEARCCSLEFGESLKERVVVPHGLVNVGDGLREAMERLV